MITFAKMFDPYRRIIIHYPVTTERTPDPMDEIQLNSYLFQVNTALLFMRHATMQAQELDVQIALPKIAWQNLSKAMAALDKATQELK